jgi:hypothetical protein
MNLHTINSYQLQDLSRGHMPFRIASSRRIWRLRIDKPVGLVAIVLLWAGLLPAAAEKRVALVIGNSAYRDVTVLRNPRNDAEDIAAALQRLGFETSLGLDADRAAMEMAIEDFASKAEGSDVALFYYAGHALQHQAVNYLMPIDANLQNAAGLRRLTKLNDIVSDVKRAKTLRILIVDACRDNPLAERLQDATGPANGTRSVGLAKLSRGFNQADASDGSAIRGGDIIVYAAEAGRTASDGTGRNSPFSAAFLRHMETEGQEIVALMRRVTTNVQQETNGNQRPELSLAVPFEFYFKPGPPQPPPTMLQLLPGAKPHEVGAVETQVEEILAAASDPDRAQVRREVMVLISDIASRSGLKPDQIAVELPRAFARLTQTRREIEEFRRLMENEPGVAPFVEIAAAAVASGRRPDLQAADQALAQAQARYDEAIRARTDALDRARSSRAALSEQRGNIAETEYRSKEAASFYLAAANDTPASDLENSARRFALAGSALFIHGANFFANDALRESIRLMEQEALQRYEQFKASTDDQKQANVAVKALVLAGLADAQTKLGGRLPGIEGAKMMIEARSNYNKALRGLPIDEFPGVAMDILDRRSQRDIEFGRRITRERGRGHFEQAVSTTRVILNIQAKYPRYHGELGRTRNNLALALSALSRRTEGEAGDRQIEEAIELFEQSIAALEQSRHSTNIIIARANLAHSLTLRAERKPGLSGAADIARAQALYEKIDVDLAREKHPRLWSIVKQYQAELLRLIGERQSEPSQAFGALKSAFELYQQTLGVISRETAPNDWAIICAEMAHTIAAALPLLKGDDRRRFGSNAVQLFDAARPYFVAGGFGQDLEKLDAALAAARVSAE